MFSEQISAKYQSLFSIIELVSFPLIDDPQLIDKVNLEDKNKSVIKFTNKNSVNLFSKLRRKKWIGIQQNVYKNRKELINEYLYYFTSQKSLLKLGSFSEQEKLLFQKQMELFQQNNWKLSELWGLFSIPFKHRNGRQCRDYYISSNLQNYRLEDEYISNNIHFNPINKSSLSSCFDYYKDKIECILSHYCDDDDEKDNNINNNNINNESSGSGSENDLIPLRIKKKKEKESSLSSSIPSSISNSPQQIKIKPLYLSSSESSESSTNTTPINSPTPSPIISPVYSPSYSPISSSSILPDINNSNNNTNNGSYYTKIIINNNNNNNEDDIPNRSYNNSYDSYDSDDDNEQPINELLQPLSPSHSNNNNNNNNRIIHRSRSRNKHRHRNRNRNSIKIIENFGNHKHNRHNSHKQRNNKENNTSSSSKDNIDKGSLSPSSVNSESIIPHITVIHNYKNSMKNRRSKKKQQNTEQNKNIRQFTGVRSNIIVNENSSGYDIRNYINENENESVNTINDKTPAVKQVKPLESEYSGRSLENKTINQLKPQKIIQFSFPDYINPINYPISTQNQSFTLIDDNCYYFDDIWSENDLESILSITFMKSLNRIINNENIDEEKQIYINILLSIDQYINYNVNLNNNLNIFYEGLSSCIKNIMYKLTTQIQQMNIVPSQVESILNIFFIYLYKWYRYCKNSEKLFYFIVSCHLYLLVINIKISISSFSTFFIPFQIIQSFNTTYNIIIDRILSSNLCLYNSCKLNEYLYTYKYNIFLIFTYSLLYKYEDESKQYVKQNTIENNENSDIINSTKEYFNTLFEKLVDSCSCQLPYIEELFKTTVNVVQYLDYKTSDYISLWNSIKSKYEESLIKVNDESHIKHTCQCTDLFCDCRIHSVYLSNITQNVKNYSNTLSFYSCSVKFLNQIIDPLSHTKRLSLIGEIKRSLDSNIFNESVLFYNAANVHLLGINTIEVEDLKKLFSRLMRMKRLPSNDKNSFDNNKNEKNKRMSIDLEVLLQSYTIVLIKYIQLNIQYNEIMLEINKLWSYIHSLSVTSRTNSLFHFLYNTIQFIFEYFVNNNVINNEQISFPIHECINMYLNETVIFNYSDVVLHYIKMISSLLSHSQYEIQQQNQHQQIHNINENSFNDDEISDLDISLLVEDNSISYQSLLDKYIIDDLYPNYHSLLKALINNIEPGTPILQDIYEGITIYEFQTISHNKNTLFKSFSFYSYLHNSLQFLMKWFSYHPVVDIIDDSYLQLLLESVIYLLFYQNNIPHKILLHFYRIIQYNTQSNFYSILIKKWLSDLDVNQKPNVKDISDKFIISFKETYELLQSNNRQQQYEKILSKIFVKIFTQFMNLTNYQSNAIKIQRIESFALNCMVKITSLLYSSIPLSPRWGLETILSNLYPFVDSEINRTEIIDDFQSKHLLLCLLNTSFKGDIYIKAKIKHLSHYIINEFQKKVEKGEWRNIIESGIYKSISEFFSMRKYQSLGLLDLLFSIISEMVLYINNQTPSAFVSYLLFLTAIFHSKQDNGSKFSCSIDSMIVFTNHHILIYILYSIVSVLHLLWKQPKHSVLMKYCFALIYKILTNILFQPISIISTQNPLQTISCCSLYNLNEINNNEIFIKLLNTIGLSCQCDIYNRKKDESLVNSSFNDNFSQLKHLYNNQKIQSDSYITGINTSKIDKENLGVFDKQVNDLWYKNFVEFLSKCNNLIDDEKMDLKEFKSYFDEIKKINK